MRITLLTKCPIKYKMVKTRTQQEKDASKYALPQDLADRLAKLREPGKPAEPVKAVGKKGGTRRKARRVSRKKTHKRKY
jgi:hypothetical protein